MTTSNSSGRKKNPRRRVLCPGSQRAPVFLTRDSTERGHRKVPATFPTCGAQSPLARHGDKGWCAPGTVTDTCAFKEKALVGFANDLFIKRQGLGVSYSKELASSGSLLTHLKLLVRDGEVLQSSKQTSLSCLWLSQTDTSPKCG